MRLHDLAPAKGARKQGKRLGRGVGGKGGKTAGKGTKGQQSRGRGKVPVGFEGGQVPLYRRTPKLPGFTNPFRVEYKAINLDTLSELGEKEVTPEMLIEKGHAPKGSLIKVLGGGEISTCLLYTSPSPRDATLSRMPSSA